MTEEPLAALRHSVSNWPWTHMHTASSI